MRPTRRRRSARICSLPSAIKISCKNGSDRKGAKIGFECQLRARMRGESIGIGSCDDFGILAFARWDKIVILIAI